MKFILEIEMGNDAMSELDDVAECIGELAEKLLVSTERQSGSILDANGNIIGGWEVTVADTFWELPKARPVPVCPPQPVEDLFFIYKQVACLDYQSCDHDGWKACTAYQFSNALSYIIEEKTNCDEEAAHKKSCDATWGVNVKPDGTLWLNDKEYWAWKRDKSS